MISGNQILSDDTKKRQRKRKRPNSGCLLLGVVLVLQLTEQCYGSDDRRRPPPPPPPPKSGARQRGDWKMQQHDPSTYTSSEIGLYQPYDEPQGDLPDTSSASWYSEESHQLYQQDGGPYRDSGEPSAYAASTGWHNNDASTTQPYPDGRQQYDYYMDNRDTNQRQQLSSDSMARNAATAATGAAEDRPRPNVPQMPIHYEFPISQDAAKNRGKGKLQAEADKDDEIASFPTTASARRDLVTRYWATKTGKAQIMISSTLIGVALGNFLGKSLIGSTNAWMVTMALAFWASTWFRTPLGELVRAMGLSLLLVLQRSRRIRKTYPTWRYIPAAIGVGSKRGLRPFPPARNPWRYTPRSPRDPDFNMMFVLVSMAFVGSMVGGNLPVIPTWMGALAGAASFAFACTWQSPRGDLARSCGMRVVSAVGELWEIQADLAIIPKATVVSSQIIDKAMILDRKHRVKDRFLSLANKGYEQASKLATQIHEQQRGGVGKNGDNSMRTDDRNDGRRRRDRRGDDGGRGEDFRDGPPPRRGSGDESDDRYDRRRRGDDDVRSYPGDRPAPPRRRPDDGGVDRNI